MSYLACARKLLDAPDAIYPQFATHNAQTLASIYHLAQAVGGSYHSGQYEFQCLHGMGEPLYAQVTGPASEGKLARPCRIYAPVGSHETLLAYLVRRLLENGANTSFVNRIGDASVPVSDLVADPVDEVMKIARNEGRLGAPHPRIALPADLFAQQGDKPGQARANSQGLNLAHEQQLASLAAALLHSTRQTYLGRPRGCRPAGRPGTYRRLAAHAQPGRAVRHRGLGARGHGGRGRSRRRARRAGRAHLGRHTAAARADALARAADLLEQRSQPLMGLIMREAGKTLSNAVAEVREAVDFLRYYGAQAAAHFDNAAQRPLGVVLAISPWNFPLAIFCGQVAAALAAGNTVLAKPAEQTPLTAAAMVALLHEAGVPRNALQLVPGTGETVGAALVAHAQVAGVMFTGSTEVARLIARQLSRRLSPAGRTIPLIAETGGQNAMVVDSWPWPSRWWPMCWPRPSIRPASACSALRLLCLQDEVADRTLTMLRDALQEWNLGNPDRLSTDVGPVIDDAARRQIEQHIEQMAAAGQKVTRVERKDGVLNGHYVAPALIEIDSTTRLQREVFGPVLHVIRFKREQLDALVDGINATGYGLTFGVHSRIDETIAHLTQRVHAGNIYVNRNVIGAMVGVQPFGGMGLSGTGPKAGGPLYLHRLAQGPASAALSVFARAESSAQAPLQLLGLLRDAVQGTARTCPPMSRCRPWPPATRPWPPRAWTPPCCCPAPRANPTATACCRAAPSGHCRARRWAWWPRWQQPWPAATPAMPCCPTTEQAPTAAAPPPGRRCAPLRAMPVCHGCTAPAPNRWLMTQRPWRPCCSRATATPCCRSAPRSPRDGALVRVESRNSDELHAGRGYDLAALFHEQSISTNTAAAGGNAQLMTMA